jgi:ATP-dependent Clp protease adaptor protein ClpS
MAIEKLNRAAREAQPRVISMRRTTSCGGTVLRLEPTRMGSAMDTRVGSAERAAGAPTAVQERQRQKQTYPNFKVVVLDDDVNTFQHVVECLVRYIPSMQPDQAWNLAHRIDSEGSAVVWCGPQEQAELYHQQLAAEGLTMAPLEPA